MNTDNRIDQIVAEFDSHHSAEEAIQQITKANIDVKNLSIIGQDYHTEEHPVGYINTGDRVVSWGKFGAFWGTIWGILFGSAIIIVPGVGSVLLAGWIVGTIVGAVEGAVIGGGLGAITAALTSIGVPNDSVLSYERAIKAGKFIVVVKGTSTEIERSKEILTQLGAKGIEISEHRVLVNV